MPTVNFWEIGKTLDELIKAVQNLNVRINKEKESSNRYQTEMMVEKRIEFIHDRKDQCEGRVLDRKDHTVNCNEELTGPRKDIREENTTHRLLDGNKKTNLRLIQVKKKNLEDSIDGFTNMLTKIMEEHLSNIKSV